MLKKRPLSPGTKSNGKNAIMLVVTANTTGMVISLTPATAASIRDIPSEILWKISSPTTTASSTTMPSVTIKPKREIMFTLAFIKGSRMSEPRIETGMPMAVQKATRNSRSNPSAKSTSIKPIVPLNLNRSMRSW